MSAYDQRDNLTRVVADRLISWSIFPIYVEVFLTLLLYWYLLVHPGASPVTTDQDEAYIIRVCLLVWRRSTVWDRFRVGGNRAIYLIAAWPSLYMLTSLCVKLYGCRYLNASLIVITSAWKTLQLLGNLKKALMPSFSDIYFFSYSIVLFAAVSVEA